MTRWPSMTVLLLAALLSGCGMFGPKEEDCDKSLRFQNREVGERVVAPEGLDQLNPYEEMQIPAADPDAAPPVPGKCVDSPPRIKMG